MIFIFKLLHLIVWLLYDIIHRKYGPGHVISLLDIWLNQKSWKSRDFSGWIKKLYLFNLILLILTNHFFIDDILWWFNVWEIPLDHLCCNTLEKVLEILEILAEERQFTMPTEFSSTLHVFRSTQKMPVKYTDFVVHTCDFGDSCSIDWTCMISIFVLVRWLLRLL